MTKTSAATVADDGVKITRAPGTHSLAAGVFNFVNSIVGAGVIGLAFALESAGLPLGIFFLLMQGALTDHSVRLIVRIGDACGVNGYEELCERLLGRGGFLCCAVGMSLLAYGAMVSYLIIIGDTCAAVLGSWTGSDLLGERHFVIAVFAICVCLPLSCVRDIGVLARTSALPLSIAAAVSIVLIVTARAPSAAGEQGIPRQGRAARRVCMGSGAHGQGGARAGCRQALDVAPQPPSTRLQPVVEPGWIAVGFSPAGRMAGSDIVLGQMLYFHKWEGVAGCAPAALRAIGGAHDPPAGVRIRDDAAWRIMLRY
eukprot:gene26966-55811_t